MTWNRSLIGPVFATLAMVAWAPLAQATLITMPVQGWVTHNGASTVTNGGTDSPTFTDADDDTFMGTFDDITLKNDGDYLTFTGKVDIGTRATPNGAATMNTQLRVGLFDGPAGAVVAGDFPNYGFIIEYSALGGLIREQEGALQANPFVGPTSCCGTGSVDGDVISGADPPLANLTLTLTRNAGKIDITGEISGGDHLSTYSFTGRTSAHFPLNGDFNFNRVGLFFGPGTNGASAAVTEAKITTNVPEPATCALMVMMATTGMLVGGRRRR